MTTITSFSPPAPPSLTLPSGRVIDGTLPQGMLYSELDRLAIPGFRHQLGRDEAITKYRSHLQSVFDEAGRAAVAQWLKSHKE